MERSKVLASILDNFRRKMVIDVFNGIIIVSLTTIVVMLLSYFLTIQLTFKNSNPLLVDFLNILFLALVLYVAFSRIGFAIWNLMKISNVSALLPSNISGNLGSEEDKKVLRFKHLLRKEYKVARKALSLFSMGIIVLVISTTDTYAKIMRIANFPTFFRENPLFSLLPISIIFFFLSIYQIIILGYIREDLEQYYDEILTLKTGLTRESIRCPVCGNKVSPISIHCPYCGALIRREG